MPKQLGRSILLVMLYVCAGFLPARAQSVGSAQLASADQLKTKAFEALRAGKFDLTNDYLSQAAAISKDPILTRMAGWARQFEEQRKVFADERRKEYDKAAADARQLQGQQKTAFAMEQCAKAYLLYDDKDGFRKQPWVSQLLADAKRLAREDEKNEQWLKALRVYSQLSAVEPEVPEWKDRLKTSTRRIRLVALYTPDDLKHIQEADVKEREEVEQMLHPTTKPATKATTKAVPDEEAENQNRIKWEDALRGVQLDMLKYAVHQAHDNYYRKVSYKKMLTGGLTGLRVIATTPALQKAFKGLADASKRNQFLGSLDASIARVEQAPRDDSRLVEDVLNDLDKSNDNTIDLPREVLVGEFADGAFGALDPFSSIIWPSDWEEFQKTTKGEFSGVGIQIMVDDSGNLKVVSPLEDSPAYRAKIKPEYIVTHINGKSAKWINTNQAVKLITGPPGTTVRLTIKDTNGNSRDYTLTRETIKVASVKGWLHLPGGGWNYFIDPDQKIGYIRMTNFSRTTTDELNAAVAHMNEQGVRGIIFDLRYNPGGLLNTATQVVDKFVKNGLDIVSTRPDRPDSPHKETVSRSHLNPAEKTATPMVVLVNQYSASASEIVSGALKDHKRAMIVGERTFGKGSVQMLYPLSAAPEAVLKLTTSHYYLPNGKCIHREEDSKEWGVEPDVSIEMTPEQMRAAIDARQEFDILRDKDATGDAAAAPEKPEKPENGTKPKVKKDPLSADPQLAGALLFIRLQLADTQSAAK